MRRFFTRPGGAPRGVLTALGVFVLLFCFSLPAGVMAAVPPSYSGGAVGPDPQDSSLNSLMPDPAGSQSGNSVTLNSGDLSGSIYGGVAGQGSGAEVSGNTVLIHDGNLGHGAAGGWTAGSGDVHGNSVTFEGGSLATGVYGGVTGAPDSTGNVYGNTVTILGGTLGSGGNADTVVGGAVTGGGTVYNNTITIKGGIIDGAVYGGESDAGDVYGNAVNIGGSGIAVSGDVAGGRSYMTGNVYNNTVNINSGASIDGSVAGGFSNAGYAYDNSVSIGGDASVGGVIYGGVTGSGGSATGNSVAISGGTVGGDIYGGAVSNGAGGVSNNSVSISGGTVQGYVNGGGSTGSGDVTDNTVTVIGGEVLHDILGGVAAGSGSANGNSVSVSGGVVYGSVYGGGSALTGTGDENGNSVSISGDSVITGNVVGGSSISGTANNNIVSISGGTVSGGVSGGSTGSGTASGNMVTISGGTVSGDVYGGYSGQGDAVNNTVTVSGSADVSNAWLYGGGGDQNSGADVVSGNTLNFDGFSGYVAGISNFQTINMYVPSSVQDGDTVVTAGIADLSGTTVNVNMASGGDALNEGDSITLIEAQRTINGQTANTTAQGMKGSAVMYDFGLAQSGDALVATVTNAKANPQYKSLSEGRLAGLALLSQGADLVADQGIRAALSGAGPEAGLSVFAVGGGSTSRYATGSHLDMDAFNMLAGAAWNSSTLDKDKYGAWMAGAFFEAGWGDYNTNDSNGGMGVDGDGATNYYGGGLLGRYQAPCGGYLDASVRMGRTNTGFNSDDIRNAGTGETADYDSGSMYYGAHAGLGYLWSLNNRADLDLFTKYLWTHQEGDDVKVTGDSVHFKDSDSQRWRTGARFSYGFGNEEWLLAPYIGAAYEYEFDGKAEASTYGYGVDQADLTGGTGIGELGMTLKSHQYKNIGVDLGLQGYTGVRDGVGGSLQLRYEF